MKSEEAINSVGKSVLASDPYWGSYLGEIDGTFSTPKGLRVRVKISQNIELPSQYAIIYQNNFVNRQPYAEGSINNFDLANVQFYKNSCDEFQEKGEFELEDKLKEIVLIALEAKLGYKVSLTHKEWYDAKRETLNDVYANKACFFQNITSDYFINTMVDVLCVYKKISAA